MGLLEHIAGVKFRAIIQPILTISYIPPQVVDMYHTMSKKIYLLLQLMSKPISQVSVHSRNR